MKIKKLLKICLEAPDKEAEVMLSDSLNNLSTEENEEEVETGHNFDDLNNLDLYLIPKGSDR